MAVFVTIIGVQRCFTMKNCLLCGEEVDVDGEFAKCTKCHTIQLTAKCGVSYSARIMLQDLAGVKKMTWVHDEHIITICGTEKDIIPKLMLKATKFSVFLNAHQIVHVTIM